jgi:hypothetical protein
MRKAKPEHRSEVLYKAVKIVLWTILCATALVSYASAATLEVPGQHTTIQGAIDAANQGDTIVVASGVYRLYSGNLNISKKALTLRSSQGAEKTIIEGTAGKPVITVAEDSHAVIDGFTITSIDDEDARTVRGGGIYCAPSSSPTIINNIITANRAVFGGGIFCGRWSTATITRNVIYGNKAVRFGGGVFSFMASSIIASNRIMENEATSAGGGIFCNRDFSRITNNLIWRNTAKSGGGISCDRSFSAMVNNTITNNVAAYGGGIFSEGGSVRIINNILWENKDDLFSASFSSSSRPDHSNIGDGQFRGVSGNISADPLFADPENGDFHLNPGSPCSDAGNPDPIYNDRDGSRNDMGAHGGPKANLEGLAPIQ